VNNLQLVQRFRQETGYSNTGPSTVTGQLGDHARAVNWIDDAYRELQNRDTWRWLQERFTLNTVNGTDTYNAAEAISEDTGLAIARFKQWFVTDNYNRPRAYLQSSGSGSSYWLTYIAWDQFQAIYKIRNNTDSSPTHITIDPQQNIVLGPTPNDIYVISSEYQKSAQSLDADSDIPEMPVDYHMIIVYAAMIDGGYFDAAEEVIARANIKYRKLLRQLEGNQMPPIRMAGALA